MNRSATAAIAALLCLAACSAPAPVTHDNPFYLASPSLGASPNDSSQPMSPQPQSHGGIGGGGDRMPGSPNGMQNTPDGMPAGGSMSLGGGGG